MSRAYGSQSNHTILGIGYCVVRKTLQFEPGRLPKNEPIRYREMRLRHLNDWFHTAAFN